MFEFHPQREGADTTVPDPIPAPDAAAESAPDPAQAEATAARTAGVGAGPVAAQRDHLARQLVMGENESGEDGDRTEPGQVVLGQIELLTEICQELHLFRNRLAGTSDHEARNPENDAVLGRLVREVPVLEILEVLAARTHLRSNRLEGEALTNAPRDRTGVAEPVCDHAPDADEHEQDGRHLIVLHRRDEVLDPKGDGLGRGRRNHELFRNDLRTNEQIGDLIDDRRILLVAEPTQILDPAPLLEDGVNEGAERLEPDRPVAEDFLEILVFARHGAPPTY